MGRDSSQMNMGHGFQSLPFIRLENIKKSYLQVALYKLASIKFFDKNPNDATISIFFNKFIESFCYYKYSSRTP